MSKRMGGEMETKIQTTDIDLEIEYRFEARNAKITEIDPIAIQPKIIR
jgi:hypothetical protein